MKDVYTRFYKDVPAEQVAALQQFRMTHPTCHLDVNGVDWEYYTGGQGDRVLLLLTGGSGAGEALHFYFRQFETEGYRLITPNYPPVTTIREMMDGLIAILDHEGVEKFSILGQSMGGLFAQVLVRRVPGGIDAIVLSHTLTASPPLDSSVAE